MVLLLLPLVWAIVTSYLGEYINCPSAEWTYPKLCYQLCSFLQLITISGFNRFIQWIGTPNVGQFKVDLSANNGGERESFLGTTSNRHGILKVIKPNKLDSMTELIPSVRKSPPRVTHETCSLQLSSKASFRWRKRRFRWAFPDISLWSSHFHRKLRGKISIFFSLFHAISCYSCVVNVNVMSPTTNESLSVCGQPRTDCTEQGKCTMCSIASLLLSVWFLIV